MADEPKTEETSPEEPKGEEKKEQKPPEYPDDLKALLADQAAKKDAAEQRIEALKRQNEELQAQIAAMKELAAAGAKKDKKDEKPAFTEDNIRALVEDAAKPLKTELEQKCAALEAAQRRLMDMEILAEKQRIIAESKGRIVEGMLDGAASLDDLRQRAVLAKKEFEAIVARHRVEPSTRVPDVIPDPNPGPRSGKTNSSFDEKVKAFFEEYGRNPNAWPKKAKEELDKLRREGVASLAGAS